MAEGIFLLIFYLDFSRHFSNGLGKTLQLLGKNHNAVTEPLSVFYMAFANAQVLAAVFCHSDIKKISIALSFNVSRMKRGHRRL